MPSAPDASRHRCLLYEGHPSEQLPVIVPLMTGALEENQRCLYLGDPRMVAMVREALEREDLDVEREVSRGALILSSDRGHLVDGRFDPGSMVAGLRRLAEDAVRDGFAGLWASGDMRWELGDDRSFERLEEYEALLELAFRDVPLMGVCQYHRDSVPPAALRAALSTHRSAYIGRALQQENLFYVPPELLLSGKDSAVAEWTWGQVKRTVEAEQRRDRTLRELERLNATLEHRVQERTADLESFAYTVSHDLRAPLRAILGYGRDLIEEKGPALDEKGRRDLDRMVDAAGRMNQLIDAVLELSRLSRQQVEPATVDLSRIALAVEQDLRRAEPGRRADVVVEPGVRAQGDPRLLAAALTNLLGNAWKFTACAPRARIEFGTERPQGRRVYYVRDNGTGFDMKYLHKLFQPFQRLHSAAQFPGTGIGLASVHRIITRHGGEVWGEGAPGAGATFRFTLPERPPAAS